MSSNKTGAVARRQRLITKALKKSLRECVNGCGRGKAGNRYCTECGTALPIFGGTATKSALAPTLPAPAFLAKSASEALTDPLWFGHRDDNDPDPAARERAWQAEYSRRLDASVTKSASIDAAPPLGDPNSASSSERELAWQQAFNHATKGR